MYFSSISSAKHSALLLLALTVCTLPVSASDSVRSDSQFASTRPAWEQTSGASAENRLQWSEVEAYDQAPAQFSPIPRDSLRQIAGRGRNDDAYNSGVKVRGMARGITVNGIPYPPVGVQVPNGFSQDPQFTVSTSLAWVNRTRSCGDGGNNSTSNCGDAEFYLDVTPLKGENASMGFQYAIQSLTNRNNNTKIFAGQSLGFRTDLSLSPTTGIAFGGEHIIQFDDTIDLGRNFYLVLSQAIPLNQAENPMMLVATAGIGSDFYGYGGNGTIGSTDCLSGNNVSSRNYPSGRDCHWGPIGSINLSFGRQLGLGMEWFGYGIGAGISMVPFTSLPLSFSFYATDFLGNTPSYIQGLCTDDPCSARFYGQATLNF